MSAVFDGEIHPLADRWPMLPADELAAMADDIASYGQREPITLDADGRLVDGRNRLAACELATIEPKFVRDLALDDDMKVAAFINSKNAHHRDNVTGQKAMSDAVQLAARGKRKNGRWVRGSITQMSGLSGSALTEAMRLAGTVLDYAPELSAQVIAKTITLNDAATQAETVRDAAAAEAAEKAKQKKDLAKLRELRPDLADKVELGEFAAVDALKVIADELAAIEKAERDRLGWIEKLCTTLTDAISAASHAAHDNNRRDLIDGWADHPELRPPLHKHLTAKDIKQASAELALIAAEWSTK